MPDIVRCLFLAVVANTENNVTTEFGLTHSRRVDDMLAEAYGLESRVITEKIVRTVADKQQLLPHVISLHGKGRRRSDPDFNRVQAMPEKAGVDLENLLQQIAQLSGQLDDLRADKTRALQDIDTRNNDIIVLRDELDSQTTEVEKLTSSLANDAGEITQQNLALSDSATALQGSENRSKKLAADLDKEIRSREAVQSELAEATATVEELSQLKLELQATIDNFQADLKAADERATEFQFQLDSQTTEVEKLTSSLANDAGEITQQNLALSDSATALQGSENRSKKLAADLDKEIRSREAVQSELAEATATVEELSQLKLELQATIDNFQADLKAADERATEFDANEKNTAHLKVEIEGKADELDSLRDELALRNEALADLETRLEESQAKCESAQLRIAALKNPEELEEIEKASDTLAANLVKETRAREGVENELAKATATVEELDQLKQELQATVDDAQADLKAGLKVADERAVEIEALEKNTGE